MNYWDILLPILGIFVSIGIWSALLFLVLWLSKRYQRPEKAVMRPVRPGELALPLGQTFTLKNAGGNVRTAHLVSILELGEQQVLFFSWEPVFTLPMRRDALVMGELEGGALIPLTLEPRLVAATLARQTEQFGRMVSTEEWKARMEAVLCAARMPGPKRPTVSDVERMEEKLLALLEENLSDSHCRLHLRMGEWIPMVGGRRQLCGEFDQLRSLAPEGEGEIVPA